MKIGIFLSLLFTIGVIILLSAYWFIPYNTTYFSSSGNGNSNFSIQGITVGMQFYPNMRYESSNISYKIYPECNLKKQNDAQKAFTILSNATTLNFYPVSSNEQISVLCQDDKKPQGKYFVAGEGGPINITQTSNFDVILNGKILLIEDSTCPNPNIAVHEILHALGFDHSQNPNNMMYPVSDCSQILGQDIPNLINNLYSYPSYPDLSFENVSAQMNGRYLDLNFTVRNNGLNDSQDSKVTIYADRNNIKEINLRPIGVGYGITTNIENLFVNQLSVNELKLIIESNSSELDKNNKIIKLEIKNN